MEIAVAHAGRFQLDEHLARSRRIEIRRLDRQRFPLFPQNGYFYPHALS
jgi:hypothetical protein